MIIDRSCLEAHRSERYRDTRMRWKQGESLISELINAKMVAGETEPGRGKMGLARGPETMGEVRCCISRELGVLRPNLRLNGS